MSDKEERQKIIDLIQREVVPALGCTEPVAVALATARSREAIGEFPESIEVLVSGNIYKNGMGAGIPGTGMVGLPIAAALGAVCGRSKEGLEVLKSVNAQCLETAKKLVEEKKVVIRVKEGTDQLYVESILKQGPHKSRVIISHRHTHIIYVEKDGETVFHAGERFSHEEMPSAHPFLCVSKVVEFADTAPLDEIRFILEGARLNEAVSDQGMTGNFGLKTGLTIQKNIKRKFIADDLAS